ncbi:MAG: DUF2865 domain-containing protein [Rhizobiales bacterium]|nr:DUF2865 domain-containing protein [Hyphomicrobiales bacterium]
MKRIVHGFSDSAVPDFAARTDLPSRLSIPAVALGCAAALGLIALFGPLGRVVAGDDAGVRDFLRTEGSRARSNYAAPAWRSLPAAPAAASAYAPAYGGRAQRALDAALDKTWPADPFATPVARAKTKAHRAAPAPLATASFSPLGRRSMCVRLCDGYPFPLGAVRGPADMQTQTGMCENLCPGAPTQLFVMPDGAEKLDDAVSADGKKYSALPVAWRHAATHDKTCSCRRVGQETSPVMSLLADLTLRRGDGVMTPDGMRVFRGATRWPLRRRDFVPVATLKLPQVARERLVSLDRAARRAPPARAPVAIAPTAPRAAQIRLTPGPLGKQVRLVGAPTPGFTLVQ